MSKKRKQCKSKAEEEPQPISWINLATEDEPKLCVPVGPRFQADVGCYTGPSHDRKRLVAEIGLCERTWSNQDSQSKEGNKRTQIINANKDKGIGEGRPERCSCPSPGSVDCVEYHVNEERMKLKKELGPTYHKWKFHEMGNLVSQSWSKQDQQTFDSLVKENDISRGDGFMMPALQALPSKSRASIVSYYLNVYLPRRISRQTRSGCREIDTDEEDESDGKMVNNTKGSRCKVRPKKEVKSRNSRSYLLGCR